VDELVGLEDNFGLAILERCNEDPIAVKVVHHKDVTVALAGSCWKTAGEVHVRLSGW